MLGHCFSRNEDDHVTKLQERSQSMNTYCTRASSCVDKPGFSQNAESDRGPPA